MVKAGWKQWVSKLANSGEKLGRKQKSQEDLGENLYFPLQVILFLLYCSYFGRITVTGTVSEEVFFRVLWFEHFNHTVHPVTLQPSMASTGLLAWQCCHRTSISIPKPSPLKHRPQTSLRQNCINSCCDSGSMWCWVFCLWAFSSRWD